MGSYQLIDDTLHYTGDGWVSVKLTKKQIKEFNKGTLDKINLDWR